jgi:phage-related protein (TIGR01555 family)
MSRKAGRRSALKHKPVPVTDKAAAYTQEMQNVRILDTFSNFMARAGGGTTNLSEGASYFMQRLTQNYYVLDVLYRNSWICRRIIQKPVKQMLKNGWKYNCSLTPEQIDHIQTVEKELHLKRRLYDGLCLGGLYGGAAGVMMIDGQPDLDEPLDLTRVMPGDFKGILVTDRWNGIVPSSEIITDINDPEYGLPEFYIFTDVQKKEVSRVHHSRVLRFTGDDLPPRERYIEQFWGASKLEAPFAEIKKRDNASANIEGLMFLARVSILKMDDFGEAVGSTNDSHKAALYQMLQAMSWLRGNFGMQVMNADDNYETHDYTFTGINDIYESFMLDVAGAAEMPVTILFGRAPAGMNATGESDLINWYNTITDDQDLRLRPVLEKVLPIIIMSTLGFIPDDFDIGFNPVYTPNSKDQADKVKSVTDAIFGAHDHGLISDQVAMQELRSLQDETGLFSNITDEAINKASDDPKDNVPMLAPPGEDPGSESESEES